MGVPERGKLALSFWRLYIELPMVNYNRYFNRYSTPWCDRWGQISRLSCNLNAIYVFEWISGPRPPPSSPEFTLVHPASGRRSL